MYLKTKEDRKAFEKDKEAFERHMKYVIQFFNSENMVKSEPDKKERLKKWRKLTERGTINVVISKEEAKTLRKKLNF